MLDRIIGVFKLDANTFEEVEHDPNATGQAAIIVTIVAILAAIGAFIGGQMGNAALAGFGEQFAEFDLPAMAEVAISPLGAALNALLGAYIAWVVWSGLTFFIGTKLFDGQADMGEMLRVLGFAQAPRLLSVFSFIPCLGPLISFIGWVWALAAGYIAVRQGLDVDNTQALVTIILSWLGALILNIFIIGPIFSLIF